MSITNNKMSLEELVAEKKVKPLFCVNKDVIRRIKLEVQYIHQTGEYKKER